ncbi:hypothetical protein APSETT444_007756 [Aspergillus pseudonomiae]
MAGFDGSTASGKGRSSGPGAGVLLVAARAAALRFRRPQKKNNAASIATPATAPITMPAIAPPDSEELGVATALVLAEEVVVVVDEVLDVDVAIPFALMSAGGIT